MRHLKVISSVTFLSLIMVIFLSFTIKPGAMAPEAIVLGPWTFQEINFADGVEDLDGLSLDIRVPKTVSPTLEAALLGYSPNSFLANIGNSANSSNLFVLSFDDLLAENKLGKDIVFFDCRFDPEEDYFEIAVRPQGVISFTNYIEYAPEDFIDTGEPCDTNISDPDPFITHWGVPIDIGRYNDPLNPEEKLPLGTIVDAIKFRSSGGLDGPGGDPSMAAVLEYVPITVFMPIVRKP